MTNSDLFVIAVGGPRGVGKTTALTSILKTNTNIRVLSIGDGLDRFSREKLQESFFKLNNSEKDLVREMYCGELVKTLMSEGGVYLLDLHYTDYRESEDKIIQPIVLSEIISLFLVFNTDNEVILSRRLLDAKVRDLIPSSIERDRVSEINAAIFLSTKYGKRCVTIDATRTTGEIVTELGNLISLYTTEGGSKERK